MSKTDPLQRQIGGDHYTNFPIPPVVFIEKNSLSFIQGCIVKYACRLPEVEDVVEDLEKIKHYCDLYKEVHHDEI